MNAANRHKYIYVQTKVHILLYSGTRGMLHVCSADTTETKAVSHMCARIDARNWERVCVCVCSVSHFHSVSVPCWQKCADGPTFRFRPLKCDLADMSWDDMTIMSVQYCYCTRCFTHWMSHLEWDVFLVLPIHSKFKAFWRWYDTFVFKLLWWTLSIARVY
jgi:hypothetical protein